jgi:hypothetical protein
VQEAVPPPPPANTHTHTTATPFKAICPHTRINTQVTGWTGFQIVQNGLVWGKLANLAFPRPGSPLVTNNGSPGISHMELKALWALMAIECVLLVFFVALAISLMWVPYMSACRQKRVRFSLHSFVAHTQ